MKNSTVVITLISLLLFQPFSMPSVLAVEDAIIAVVDEELITLKDLKDYISAVYTQLKMEGTYSDADIEKIMRNVQQEGINRLIEDRLILNAAKEKGIEIRKAAIDEKINAIRSKYASEQEFVNILTGQGLTLSDLRERFLDQMKSQYFIDVEIKSAIKVNPQEVTDYYNQHPDEFIKPEHARVISVFFPFANGQDTARNQASETYESLKKGVVIEDAAKKSSSRAIDSTIFKGQMKPEIEENIFQLNKGGFTGPIETTEGLFIFKLVEKFPSQSVPLLEAQDQITQYLFNTKLKDKMKTWFEETKKKTFIEIKNSK